MAEFKVTLRQYVDANKGNERAAADKLGFPFRLVGKWLSGERKPDLVTQEMLQKFMQEELNQA